MSRVFFLLLTTIVVFANCKDPKHRRLDSEKGLKVRFEIKNFEDKMGECEKQDGSCAQIDMVYPIVTDGVAAVKQAINDSIYNYLINILVFEEYQGDNTQAALSIEAKSFFKEWQTASDESADSLGNSNWEVSVTGEVGLHTPKVVSITLGAYSYAGGAHPNSFVSVKNFDLKTGKTLSWKDIVTDLGALEKLAAQEFKKARELPADADLIAEGYFWEGKFTLPTNFELQKDGIYFWYNPYEAAAYAFGPTDFIISYKDLDKLVKKEVIF
jgi:hypothetical protein